MWRPPAIPAVRGEEPAPGRDGPWSAAGATQVMKVRETSMQNRRGFLARLAICFGVMGLIGIGGMVFADELLGVITKVDVEGKKITVVEKGSDKEHQIKVTDETEVPRKGGSFEKIDAAQDLEKLDTRVKKAHEKGHKGVPAKITHEKNVASKIEYIRPQRKKKAAE